MVFAYSKMVRVIALNVETINYFCLPHLVEVRVIRMLSVCFALVMVTFICCENVSSGSSGIPRILGCFVVAQRSLLFRDKQERQLRACGHTAHACTFDYTQHMQNKKQAKLTLTN